MKVIIFLLSAVVCSAAVNAAISGQTEGIINPDFFMDQAFVNEISEVEARGFFGGLFWILKAALRTLKGVNCVIKQIKVIKVGTQNFLDDIHYCGADAVQSFKNVIASAQSLRAACNDVINTYEKYCSPTNGKPNTSFSCKYKLIIGVLKVNKQIDKTVKAAKKIPSVPGEASACSNAALSEFISLITSLPSTVKSCSKLTS